MAKRQVVSNVGIQGVFIGFSLLILGALFVLLPGAVAHAGYAGGPGIECYKQVGTKKAMMYERQCRQVAELYFWDAGVVCLRPATTSSELYGEVAEKCKVNTASGIGPLISARPI
jgi:hypothetical protein